MGRQCNIATLPKLNGVIDALVESLKQCEKFATEAKVAEKETSKIKATFQRQVQKPNDQNKI